MATIKIIYPHAYQNNAPWPTTGKGGKLRSVYIQPIGEFGILLKTNSNQVYKLKETFTPTTPNRPRKSV